MCTRISTPKERKSIFKNEKEFRLFVQDLEDLDKDPVQVDLYLKAHGLDQVEGLKDYILNNDKLNRSSVNELIQTQKFNNIANNAHGILGVNKAIDKYNELVKESSKDTDKFVKAISNSNSEFGKYLSSLKTTNGQYIQAGKGLKGYAGHLAIATAKTFALEAATTVLNATINFGFH